MTYIGPEGSGHNGPFGCIKSATGQSDKINPMVTHFIFRWTEDQVPKNAKMSEKCGRGDWVKASASRHDEAGNKRQRPILVQCAPNVQGRRHG